LREHPGHIEYLRIQAFVTTLTEVFGPNWQELIFILNEAATNPDVAIEIVQNIQSASVGHGATAQINRCLHNYVAATMTLVDHSRPLMKGRSGSIVSEYDQRKAELLQNPEIPFIQCLRNVSLHRSLPLLGHTLRMTQTGIESSEVELSVADLLDNEYWNAAMRKYIKSHGDRIPLRPVIQRHHDLVYSLNSWLINEMSLANRPALNEANELLVAVNAALMGVDLETARHRTDQDSQRRM